MSRRLLIACAAALCLLLFGQTTAAAQSAAGESPSTTYGDVALIDALYDAALTDEWLGAAPVSEQAALIAVTGNDAYDDSRAALLASLRDVADRRAHLQGRTARLDRAEDELVILEDLTRELRRQLVTNSRSAAVSIDASDAHEARQTLQSIARGQRWVGFSLDPVALAEYQLAQVKDELAREVDVLTRVGTNDAKSAESAVGRLSALYVPMHEARILIDGARALGIESQFLLASERAAAIELMPALHQQRTLSRSAVGGLTVVTVDAYVQAAALVPDDCVVDWALLAGIGRIESRHGTLDDATVLASGNLTKSIFGPLLDGGATAAEAEAAIAQAEAEAQDLADQEAAEAAAQAEIDAAYAATLYGGATEEQVEALEEAEASRAPVGLAAEPVIVEPTPEPEFDPLIWGDDLPVADDDEDDTAETDDDTEDGEEEIEIQARGNGFAVIRDSDNGRLDGNARWDRAVGPMQFIPETWSYFETDGNGDGRADPQNLYDAAATAADFLCHLSRTRGGSPWTFVLGYNSSQTYVRNVMAAANGFAANDLPTVG